MTRIGVVVPCRHARDHVLAVLAAIGPEASAIYVVDDACPENTGRHVRDNCADPRVRVIRSDRELGPGGATVRGYREALGEEMDILVRLDPASGADPARLESLVRPLVDGQADYAKGNRWFHPAQTLGAGMGTTLRRGLASLGSKLATGYWDITDPGHGFTALHATVARAIPVERVACDARFAVDMLFRLGELRAVVVDVPMPQRQAGESPPADARTGADAGWFLARAAQRLAYAWVAREINAGTVQLVIGIALLLAGALYAAILGARQATASAGEAMLAALPIVVATQCLLGALRYDVANVPRQPIHAQLVKRKEAALSATGWVRQG